jgi:protein O-mannosyl-transferase
MKNLNIFALYRRMFNDELSRRNLIIYIIFGILLLTTIIYSNSLNNDFSDWDDNIYVIHNEDVQNFGKEALTGYFTKQYSGHYQPITMLSYGLQAATSGNHAYAFHMFDLIVHLLNIILVFWLILLLGKRIRTASLAALLFAVHPILVEDVAWIGARNNLLFCLFGLASMIAYFYYAYEKKRPRLNYFLAILLFIMAVMSKSMAVVFPVLFVITDIYMARKKYLQLILEKIPFILISVAFGLMAIQAATSFGSVDSTTTDIGINQLFYSLYAFAFYIIKFFIPFHLSAIHAAPEITTHGLPLLYYMTPLVPLAMVVLYFLGKSFRREFLFSVLFYSVSIVLVLKTVGGIIVAERYAYLPFVGLAFLTASFYGHLEDRLKARWPRNLMLGLILVLLAYNSITTYKRTAVWQNGYTLFTDMTLKDPTHYYGFFGLGNMYFKDDNYEKAMVYYDISAGIEQLDARLYGNRGLALLRLGKLDSARINFDNAIQLQPDNHLPYNNRGLVFFEKKQLDSAMADFSKSIELSPTFAEAYYNRGNAYAIKNKMAEAEKDFLQCILADPGYAMAYTRLGNLQVMKKDYKKAEMWFTKALEVDPFNQEALLNRGSTFLALEKFDQIYFDWFRAFQLGNQEAYSLIKKYFKNYDSAEPDSIQFNLDALQNNQIEAEELVNMLKTGENKIKVEETEQDGKKLKTINRYNQNGVLIEEGIVNAAGKYAGAVKWFYDNGKLKISGFYNDTIPYGSWKEFYDNGKHMAEYTYKNGKLDGSYKYYHKNGQLWTERIYRNGLMWEVVSNFDQDGKPLEPGTLKEGTGTLNAYSAEGKLLGSRKYLNGKEIK